MTRKEDIAEAIRKIKASTEREVVLELDEGSVIFKSSDNLKLIKKTGEVLGKNVKIYTEDEVGLALVKKADMLADEFPTTSTKIAPRVARSDVKPRFSDIMGPRTKQHHQPLRSVKFAPVQKSSSLKPRVKEQRMPQSDPEFFNRKFKDEIKTSRSNFSKYFLFGIVVLVVSIFALAVLLPKTTITVLARSEPINRDFEILVDKAVAVANASRMEIPALSISKEVSETKSFDTSGVSGTKASGSVVIHNLTENTLTLRATTTTLSVNGKRYFFTSDATGVRGNNAANNPIAIVAEGTGPDYNLPAGTRLALSNQALGATNQVYAVTSTAITSQQSSNAKIFSQEDFDRATADLLASVTAKAEEELSREHGTKIVIVENGVSKEVLAKAANKEIGEATDHFDMTMIARISGIAMKQEDISNVVVSKINEVLSNDKYLVEGADQKSTATFKSVDRTASKGVLAVHFETIAAYRVESQNLAKILSGKNEMEIKEILLSKPEIDDVQVEFWPQWLVHKAPRLNGKIYINTILSK